MAKPASLTAFLSTSVSSLGLVAITFVSGVLIARALGPEARGDYGAALLIAQTVAALGILSFFEGAIVVIRRDRVNPIAMLPSMLLATIAISMLSCGLLTLVTSLQNYRFETITSNFFIFACVIIIVFNCFSTLFAAVERSQMEFTWLNLFRIAGPMIFTLVLVLGLVFGQHVFSTTTILLVFIFSKLPFIVAWTLKYFRCLLGRISYSFIKKAFLAGISLHPAVALEMIASQVDRWFALATWPKDQLGLYFVAFSAVGASFSVLTSAMRIVLFPYLSGLHGPGRVSAIERFIRLAIVASLTTVLLGWLALPHLIPLVYGADFERATSYSLGLLCAMSIIPVQVIALEGNRSRGRGFAAAQMSIAMLVVMFLGYWLIGYDRPPELILGFGLSNLASTVVGLYHLSRSGDVKLGRSLVPSVRDLRYILSILERKRGATEDE